MAGILHPRAAPLRARPAAIPIDVRRLGIVDVCEGDDGVLLRIEGDLPHPVSDVGGVIDHGCGMGCGIARLLVDVVHAVGDDRELVALDVAQDGAVAVVDVHDVEVEPVGLLVVGVAGGVGKIDFVLAVALVLGVWACSCALDNLLGAEVKAAVVVGIGHGEARDGGMPIDASPAEVDVVGVVREDEWRGIGGVVGRGETLLVAKGGDVAGPARDAVPDAGLIGVARVEDHHALVGQHDEGGVVVVVGLEIAADEHVGLAARRPVILRGLDIAVHVDVAQVGGIDGAGGVLVVHGTRVGKPAPCTLVADEVAAKGLCTRADGGRQREHQG